MQKEEKMLNKKLLPDSGLPDFNQILKCKCELGKFPPVDIKPIYDLAQADVKFTILTSAIELKIFDSLKESKSIDELAVELDLQRKITEKLCNALVAFGFLLKKKNKYFLSELSETFLSKDSPYYQGNYIRHWQRMKEESWNKLQAVVKEGLSRITRKHFPFDETFILAMAEGAIVWDLPKTITVLKNIQEFINAKKVLDLGGGHGLYAIAFTRVNPNLKAYVFDFPYVIENVAKHIVSNVEKVDFIAGDFTKDNIGSGYDIVFTSDFLYPHGNTKEQMKNNLNKIHLSLNDGGLIVSKHGHIDALYKDATAAHYDLLFSIVGGADWRYSTGEFCEILKDSGFSLVQVHDISTSFSPSRIVIAKKRSA